MTGNAPGPVALSSLGDPAVIRDPYPLLARMREASPFTEFGGALIVYGKYADCSRILRDPRASSRRNRSLLARFRPDQASRTRSFLSLDPPDHTRLRRLVSKAFTPRVVAALSGRISQVTDELLTRAREAGGGELELVSSLAYPLPLQIICELLGVPPGDQATFAAWSAILAHSVQPGFGDQGKPAETDRATAEFREYFSEMIAARRSRPGEDLLTKLIRAEDEGQRLTVDEIISTLLLLLVAGHETTASLISNAMLALLRHRDQLAALAADPGLAAKAVEETLRYDPPVQLTSRVSTGRMIARDGVILMLLLSAANRDPAVFTDPDTFDIMRGRDDHLAFSAGPHFCLGTPLARLEGTIALRAITTRVVRPLLDDDSLVYKPNYNLRGPGRMVIKFDQIR
ncbi:MAG TPA: cytochrome P450 [Streptosporangiaceae bacterium]|nr:cytochrome P450 [Streptosporangiaceae bacterium]